MYFVEREGNDPQQFQTLTLALAFATECGVFVKIVGEGVEIVGVFGVSSIKDGKCPDGSEYTWKKRRI